MSDIGFLTDGDWILAQDYAASGVRLLQVGDVGIGRFIGKSNRFISPERAKELNCTLLKPGDILISRMPDPIGRACVLPDLGYDAITAVDVTIFRPSNDKAVANFLVHYFCSDEWFGKVLGSASGATRARISRSNLESLEIPLPSLATQGQIAEMLNEQFATLGTGRASAAIAIEAASALEDAYLERAFASQEANLSVQRPLNEIVEGEEAITDGPFGSNLKTEHYQRSGARVVRLQNIGRGVFLDTDKAYVSLEHFNKLQKHAVVPDDIVVAALGDGARPAGRSCLVPKDFGVGLVKADCFRVRVNKKIAIPEFVVAFLNSPRRLRTVSGAMRGATRPRVTLAMLRDTQIPVPSLSIQRSILSIIQQAVTQSRLLLESAKASKRDLDLLSAALLQRAFSSSL